MPSVNKKIYLFGNWKMYLDYEESVALAKDLVKEYVKNFPSEISMTVLPSTLAIKSVVDLLKDSPISVGAQNSYWIPKGGYTGEVSVEMLKKIGVKYILVGHSERRHIFKESNHEVRKKLEAILEAELIPVVCVGETEKEREEGKTEEVIETELRALFEDIIWPVHLPCFIAYEPVWAVGTGKACEPEEAERMHAVIQKLTTALVPNLNFNLLYGGSVRKENITSYIEKEHIQGVLVGQASVKNDSWSTIVSQCV